MTNSVPRVVIKDHPTELGRLLVKVEYGPIRLSFARAQFTSLTTADTLHAGRILRKENFHKYMRSLQDAGLEVVTDMAPVEEVQPIPVSHAPRPVRYYEEDLAYVQEVKEEKALGVRGPRGHAHRVRSALSLYLLERDLKHSVAQDVHLKNHHYTQGTSAETGQRADKAKDLEKRLRPPSSFQEATAAAYLVRLDLEEQNALPRPPERLSMAIGLELTGTLTEEQWKRTVFLAKNAVTERLPPNSSESPRFSQADALVWCFWPLQGQKGRKRGQKRRRFGPVFGCLSNYLTEVRQFRHPLEPNTSIWTYTHPGLLSSSVTPSAASANAFAASDETEMPQPESRETFFYSSASLRKQRISSQHSIKIGTYAPILVEFSTSSQVPD